MAAPISNIDGIKFNEGFMYASPLGDGSAAQSVRFGGLQNIAIDHRWEFAELNGPEGLSPLGVGVVREELRFSAEWGSILASAAKLLGGVVGSGSVSVVGTETRLRKKSNEEPIAFDLDLETPDTGADFRMTMYRCLAESWQIFRADSRGWAMQNFAGRAYGKTIAGDHVLYDMYLPGNQTDSTTSAGQPLAVV